jgi:CheY-like chemotaxis protein
VSPNALLDPAEAPNLVEGEVPADLSLIDLIGEGAVVVGPTDVDRYVGPRLRMLPDHLHDEVIARCIRVLHDPNTHYHRSRLSTIDGDSLEILVRRADDRVVGLVVDGSDNQRLQSKIDAIDKAGAELVRIESQAIDELSPAQRLKLVEEKVIRVTRDLIGFDHFCIRLIDPAGNRLEPVVADGLPNEALDVELSAEDEANGISGYVARTGKSYVCDDVPSDPRYIAGLDGALSSLTVPLMLDDSIVGILNVESRLPHAFDEDDRQFAEIFGRYVAIALSILRLLVHERAVINKRLADNVAGEVAGPLNDIALDAQSLIDDFVGNEELRARLQSILFNVAEIRRGVKDASSGTKAVLGTREVGDDQRHDDVLSDRSVLVVDDEPAIRETVSSVLRKHGVSVVICTTGSEAIAALGQGFDLVLSDIRMPDKSGYDVFAAVRKLPEPPPVILMTGFGYDPNHCIVRASQEGLAAVLFKPFRVEQMLSEVRGALTSSALTSG